jgi:hypothetical protein
MTEGDLIGRILGMTKPGETLEVEVLRGEGRVALRLPMQ